MDDKIEIERLRYAKIYGEGRLFHYLDTYIYALEKVKT